MNENLAMTPRVQVHYLGDIVLLCEHWMVRAYFPFVPVLSLLQWILCLDGHQTMKQTQSLSMKLLRW